MPGNRSNHLNEELLELTRSLKESVRTSELFGEDTQISKRQRSLSSPLPPKPSVMSNDPARIQKKLETLYQEYSNCKNCPLSLHRNKIVFGMGSLNPKALFVGEGPGFDEDQSGLPFVGKAGMLLDKILKSIGLDRNNVYIANIVKCHPLKDPKRRLVRGNDRPPEPHEVEACKPILDQQIEILNPPVLCALGATAAKVLLKTGEGISRLRGRRYDFEFPVSRRIVPIIPTYHPAALLRNEHLKKDVWHDMKLIREIISNQ